MSLRSLLVLSIMFVCSVGQSAEYIVKYSNQKTLDNMFYSVQKSGSVELTEVHYSAKLARLQIADSNEIETLANLSQMGGVEYVVKNFEFKAFRSIATPLANLRDQYANQITSARTAWEKAGNQGSRDVKVAVIDTGADYNHESLRDNMLPGYDFAEDDDDPQDKTSFQNPGHGTHCSGSVGATGNVDNGIAGASPVVSIIPIRFLNENGSGDLLDSVKAIDFAIENGAHIISASWGAKGIPEADARPILEAIQRAQEAGVSFVAAAGNDGANNDKVNFFPTNAQVSNVIAVAASDSGDKKASFSNYGVHKVHIAAPGANIISTTPKNKYQNLSGTSMAAPFVSGSLAFLKAQDMTLTPEELKALVQYTGDKVDIQNACNCRINVESAVNAVTNNTPFFVPVTTTVQHGETQNFYVKDFEAVEYTSSDEAIATINADGVLTAGTANGEVTLTAKNAAGETIESMIIRISDLSDSPDNGGGGGGGGDCPFGDPALCEIICPIQPDLCSGFGV